MGRPPKRQLEPEKTRRGRRHSNRGRHQEGGKREQQQAGAEGEGNEGAQSEPLGAALLEILKISGRRPTAEDLASCLSPDLNCDIAVQVIVNHGGRCNPASPRDTAGEGAKDGQGLGMRPTEGTPYNRLVRNVLALQGDKVGAVLVELELKHGVGAVAACVQCIRRSDTDVQRRQPAVKGRRQHIGRTQRGAGDEARSLGLGRRITL